MVLASSSRPRLPSIALAVGVGMSCAMVVGCTAPAADPALEFRPVLLAQAAGADNSQPPASPVVQADLAAQLASLDCTDSGEVSPDPEPSAELVTCDVAGAEKFVLGPAHLDGSMVDRVSVAPAMDLTGAEATDYVITVELSSDGTAALADMTARLSGLDSPRNRLALVTGSRVLSAPVVMAAITEGDLTIAGAFTESEARDIAATLGADFS